MQRWLSLLVCLTCFNHVLTLKNLNVTRTVDLKTNVIRINHEISLTETPSEYLFVVESDEWSNLAYVEASIETKKGTMKIPVKPVSGQPNALRVDLGKPSAEPISFKVVTIFTELLEPKPSKILQSEKQLIRYRGNIYFYSPYETKYQQTQVVLPKGQLLAYSDLPKTPLVGSNRLTYGSYEDVMPYSKELLSLHFENDTPFVMVTEMTRHIEVSHWGNIAVEESLEIVNSGAKLRGPFSRLDYDYGIGKQSCLSEIRTALPAAAKNIYYRDEIGNISTSTVKELLDSMELSLTPRFPLMGGWKTQYILGYNVPAYEFLYRSGSQFALVMRFMDHIYDNQYVRNLTVKIVLPEMVYDIEFHPPYPVFDKSFEILKTYLDTVGRTVVVAKASNLVSEHIMDFTVKYRFNMILILREPLMLITAFAVIFAVLIIYVRLDFSIYKDEKNELRMRAQAMVENAQSLLKQRSSVYHSYEDILQKYRSHKNSSQFTVDRRKLETDHKNITQQLHGLQLKMAELYPDGVEKLNELRNLDQRYRDLIQESIQLTEKIITGKITKPQYQASDEELTSKKTDFMYKMDSIIECL